MYILGVSTFTLCAKMFSLDVLCFYQERANSSKLICITANVILEMLISKKVLFRSTVFNFHLKHSSCSFANACLFMLSYTLVVLTLTQLGKKVNNSVSYVGFPSHLCDFNP